MDRNICVSFEIRPEQRCSQIAKLKSVFCEHHSAQHLTAYLKYKKLEGNLKEIKPHQSVKYYLKSYSTYNKAYQERFKFREKSIAYEARDIGHQIRLDWLWEQINLCITNLERIFHKVNPISKQDQEESHRIFKTNNTNVNKSNNSTSNPITKQDREESRRIFKTFVKTKRRTEDYQRLIQEYIKLDKQQVEIKFQKYIDDISKLLGNTIYTIDKIINIGYFYEYYKIVVNNKSNHEYSFSIAFYGNKISEEDKQKFHIPILNSLLEDNPQKYAYIGYKLVVGKYINNIPESWEKSPLHCPFRKHEDEKMNDEINKEISDMNNVDKSTHDINYFVNILKDKNSDSKEYQELLSKITFLQGTNFLTFISSQFQYGYIIFVNSKILQTLSFNIPRCYMIFYSCSMTIYFSNVKQIFIVDFAKRIGSQFTYEQLREFNYEQFIKEKGQYDKLLKWHIENCERDECESHIKNVHLDAELITEYYLQVAVKYLEHYALDIITDEVITNFNKVFKDFTTLEKIFPFIFNLEMAKAINSSGALRRDLEDYYGLKLRNIF